VATNNFGLCFAANKLTLFGNRIFHLATEEKFWLPVGACRKKLISDPV